jgi:hypothetical protein
LLYRPPIQTSIEIPFWQPLSIYTHTLKQGFVEGKANSGCCTGDFEICAENG